MSNITRIGLAAALILGSASVALAQSYESGVEQLPPHATRAHGGYSDRQFPNQGNYAGPNASYNYHENTSPDQPWSTSMDPGNTNGGG